MAPGAREGKRTRHDARRSQSRHERARLSCAARSSSSVSARSASMSAIFAVLLPPCASSWTPHFRGARRPHFYINYLQSGPAPQRSDPHPIWHNHVEAHSSPFAVPRSQQDALQRAHGSDWWQTYVENRRGESADDALLSRSNIAAIAMREEPERGFAFYLSSSASAWAELAQENPGAFALRVVILGCGLWFFATVALTLLQRAS